MKSNQKINKMILKLGKPLLILFSVIFLLSASVSATVDYCINTNGQRINCAYPFNNYCEYMTQIGQVDCAVSCQPSIFIQCCSYNGCSFSTTITPLYTTSSYNPDSDSDGYTVPIIIFGCVFITAAIAILCNAGNKRRKARRMAAHRGGCTNYATITVPYPVGHQAYPAANTFNTPIVVNPAVNPFYPNTQQNNNFNSYQTSNFASNPNFNYQNENLVRAACPSAPSMSNPVYEKENSDHNMERRDSLPSYNQAVVTEVHLKN